MSRLVNGRILLFVVCVLIRNIHCRSIFTRCVFVWSLLSLPVIDGRSPSSPSAPQYLPYSTPKSTPQSTPHQHRLPLGPRWARIKVMACRSGTPLFTQSTLSFTLWIRFSAARAPLWALLLIPRPSSTFLLLLNIVPGALPHSLSVERPFQDMMTHLWPV